MNLRHFRDIRVPAIDLLVTWRIIRQSIGYVKIMHIEGELMHNE